MKPALLEFIANRGWETISDWAEAAGIPPNRVYQARIGRGLSKVNIDLLAQAANVDAATVENVLIDVMVVPK
jgi:hypothetical protein